MTTTEVKATPQLKGVLFDLGNTLLHFNGDWDNVAKELYSELYKSLITTGFDLDRVPMMAAVEAGYRRHELRQSDNEVSHDSAVAFIRLNEQFHNLTARSSGSKVQVRGVQLIRGS